MKNILIFIIIISSFFHVSFANNRASTYVDKNGIMRWTKDKSEVTVFGINYTVPFSYYKMRSVLGTDQYKAIDEDVYHLSRMGINGFRIHIWDCYISDEKGNLVENEFLNQYDYLHYKLKQRNFKMYINPMNLFKDIKSGFINKYSSKADCLADPQVIPIMENYMRQFLNHVNPYTKIAYKDDPDIIALEIINEPAHWKNPKLIPQFINSICSAIRSTGCGIPIFYNMTTCSEYIDSILPTKIQGGSFQWYPTGLTNNFSLSHNCLPSVDEYYIPFDKKLKEHKLARFIYEFSPADVEHGEYMIPAMARSFREKGFQFAAKFAYDPLHVAFCNIEFRTHFLNFLYTPQKAIAMRIANQVFHDVPLYKSYGRYPQNNRFGNTIVDGINKRSEYLSDKMFFYTSTSSSIVPNPSKLNQIAGIGNSAIVKYDGTGAYFFDKLKDGVWRLEINPDAFIVNDPFHVTSLEKDVAILIYRAHNMEINIPDLGKDFCIEGIDKGNIFKKNINDEKFRISSGVYILKRKGVESKYNTYSKWDNGFLGEYYKVNRKPFDNYVQNNSAETVKENTQQKLSFRILSTKEPLSATLFIINNGKLDKMPLNKDDEYNYSCSLPLTYTKGSSVIRYFIEVKYGESDYETYPSSTKSKYDFLFNNRVYDGDFNVRNSYYTMFVLSQSYPIYIFNANEDCNKIIKFQRKENYKLVPSKMYDNYLISFSSYSSSTKKNENLIGIDLSSKDSLFKNDSQSYKYIELKASYLNSNVDGVKISLILNDNSSYSTFIKTDSKQELYKVPLNSLKADCETVFPLPFPTFRVQRYCAKNPSKFDLTKLDELQIQCVSGKEKGEIGIQWIRLTKE